MSSKTKITFSCSNCGTKYPKWLGQCTVCEEWNTIAEEIVNTKNKNDYKFISKSKAVDINDINYSNDQRIFFSIYFASELSSDVIILAITKSNSDLYLSFKFVFG